MTGLELVELSTDDASEYVELVARNGEHLARDYAYELDSTVESLREYLLRPADSNHRFGIRLHGRLIGRIDLNPVDPPRYGFGYWLDAASCGRGYATKAGAVVVEHARAMLGATDVYAGVTHGNAKSVAVLMRLGFVAVARFETYTRFHRSLASPLRLPPEA
jgi:ribosomal-protein-serine acetyltransferase